MKFLRHLAVVTLMVGIVVGLGLAWNKFAPSTLLGYQPALGPVQFKGPVPGARLPGHPGKVIGVEPGPSVLSTFTNPASWRDLRHTVLIEFLVLTAVVIIDVVRRRLRRLDKAREAD